MHLNTHLRLAGVFLGLCLVASVAYALITHADDVSITGKLGVGTTNPLTRLAVTDGAVGLEVVPGPSTVVLQAFDRSTSSYGNLRIDTNGPTMMLDTNGNVGIGVTAPTERLEVLGDITADAVHVAAGAQPAIISETELLIKVNEEGTHDDGVAFLDGSGANMMSIEPGELHLPGSLFAELAADLNGSLKYCADCLKGSSPCSGSGTGTFAFRIAGAWECM